jgi:hypothetical protein
MKSKDPGFAPQPGQPLKKIFPLSFVGELLLKIRGMKSSSHRKRFVTRVARFF